MKLPHRLDRAVTIRARRATVFSFFTDTERFASWWGAGSSIEPRPGGAVVIRYPNGVVVRGEVVEIREPDRVVFTYGYEAADKPIPVGGSLVTITLLEDAGGTVLTLRHEFADAAARDQHVPGWRFQLSLFANIASAAELEGSVAGLVDAFFAAWSETDADRRQQTLQSCCTEDVAFHDRHAALAGRDELDQHIAASQRFFPGVALRRQGPVRHCQGTALADWTTAGPGGNEPGRGTNVFELTPEGRIRLAVGLPAV